MACKVMVHVVYSMSSICAWWVYSTCVFIALISPLLRNPHSVLKLPEISWIKPVINLMFALGLDCVNYQLDQLNYQLNHISSSEVNISHSLPDYCFQPTVSKKIN